MENNPLSLTVLEENSGGLTLSSALLKEHDIIHCVDLFSLENPILPNILEGKSALFVLSETVSTLYGTKIARFLDKYGSCFRSHTMVLRLGEQKKNLETVSLICEEAQKFHLQRNHPIVAIGGGVCLDCCGLAASLFRRGVPHIKIPTTFVGIIDAGIAIKNGVNFKSKKNLIGTFTPPLASILDPLFLQTLPKREICCGIAESLKMGLIADAQLYNLWHEYAEKLLSSNIQEPEGVAEAVIQRSVKSMMNELSENMFEYNTYKRAVDFGHTFSPYIEQHSNYEILHGEAVAIDMALCCYLSYRLGWMDCDTYHGLLALYGRLGLPLMALEITHDGLWDSLLPIIAHRGGQLNLVLPKGVGKAGFVEKLADIDRALLKEGIENLKTNHEASCSYSLES